MCVASHILSIRNTPIVFRKFLNVMIEECNLAPLCSMTPGVCLCSSRSQCCPRSSQPSSTAVTCLCRHPVDTCGEKQPSLLTLDTQSKWNETLSYFLSFFLCYFFHSFLCVGGRSVLRELMAPTLMCVFLRSPWRATRMTRPPLLATPFKSTLALQQRWDKPC